MLAVSPQGGPLGTPVLVDLPRPEPQPGEVLVRVRATAINRADLLQLHGLYPPPPTESEIPGLECAGVVVGADPAGGGPQPGERVMALLGGGGHAAYVAVPVGQLMPVPEQLSWIEAAAVPEAALTAWTNLVEEGRLVAGEWVLISGVTGGVGSFAAQVARELGARVIGSGRDLERIEALDLDAAVLADDTLAEEVRRIASGVGVDVVLDLVSGTLLDEHLAALAPRGRLILAGLMAGHRAEIDLSRVLRRRLRITGSVLRPRPREEKAELVAAFAEFGVPRLADGRLRPAIARTLPFERIVEAYAAMERGGHVGKIVLEMAP